MKKHNFNAGPAILPQSVMSEAALAVTDFNNSGLSLLEISHRDKAFIAVMDEAQQLVVGDKHWEELVEPRQNT